MLYGWPAICDKLQYVTNCNMWQTAICDKLQYVTNCNMWQTAICDKLQYVTNRNMWQPAICDKLQYVTNCNMWQTVICDKLQYVTNYNMWQTSFLESFEKNKINQLREIIYFGLLYFISIRMTIPWWRMQGRPKYVVNKWYTNIYFYQCAFVGLIFKFRHFFHISINIQA